ncbi:MAG: hypothetical protein LBD54_02675 [Puniceicoccales bacterium]|jgi:hypothetical protein|nr:hypothetical protein [Puniceicoccales bacterium]
MTVKAKNSYNFCERGRSLGLLCSALALAAMGSSELGAVRLAAVPKGTTVKPLDHGQNERAIYRFLQQKPPCLSFLERVGLLSKNTAGEKTLEAGFQLHESEYPSNGNLAVEETLALPAIGEILGLSGDEQRRCAVLVFGDAQLSSRECDDLAGAHGPRVRSLPQGVIKHLGSGVELILPSLPPVARTDENPGADPDDEETAEAPRQREIQLLVFLPGEEPVWHVVKFKRVAGTAARPELRAEGSEEIRTEGTGSTARTVVQSQSVQPESVRPPAGATVLPRGEILPDNADGNSASAFLSRADEPCASLLAQLGVLSPDTTGRKTLATALHLRNLALSASSENRICLDLRPVVDEAPVCAVKALGTRFAAEECDDEPHGLRLRSLPNGWLLKHSGPNGPKVNLLPPSDGQARLIVFVPGVEPVCHVLVLGSGAESVGPAAEPEPVSRGVSIPPVLALAADSEPKENPSPPAAVSADESTPASGEVSNPPPAVISSVLVVEFTPESVAQALTSYLHVDSINSEPLWVMDYGNAFCIALLCNGVEHLGPADARALYEAYAELSREYGKSPIYLHRVLNLFLSMSPYLAHTFLAGIKESGQRFVTEFFRDSSLEAILRSHFGEEVDDVLVLACLEQMQSGLDKWKSETFDPQKAQVFQVKDACPDLWTAYQEAYGYQDRAAIHNDQKTAIGAAERLFAKDTSAHVLYPYCLWKTIPIPSWQDVLRPYYAPSEATMDDFIKWEKEHWLTKWPSPGLLSCTGYDTAEKIRRQIDNSRDCRGPNYERYGLHPLPNASSGDRKGEDFVFASIMDKLADSGGVEVRLNKSLQLMHALGAYLDQVRSCHEAALSNPEDGGKRTKYEQIFDPIQRATGKKDFRSFLSGAEWAFFVQQVMDNSIEMERCLHGVKDAMVAALPSIIRPALPSEFPPVFFWMELALRSYHECWLRLFDSHIHTAPILKEERTYGPPFLYWKVNPIFALPKVDTPGSSFPRGREAVSDCLEPFKTGRFHLAEDNDGAEYGTLFLSAGNKKNTSKTPNGEFEFTYITPFSPVEVLYRAARPLFHKRVAGSDAENHTLSAQESEAFDDILRLLLSRPDIRNEYLSFIAAFPDAEVKEDQETRWGFNPADPRAVVPSFRSIAYMAVNSIGGDVRIAERVAALNAHLWFWKIGMQGLNVYFFPSVEACKMLALDLGYVRDGADLAGYQYIPPVPNFDLNHDRPAPPAGSFYKHFNLYGERIDVDEREDSEKLKSEHKRLEEEELTRGRNWAELWVIPNTPEGVKARVEQLWPGRVGEVPAELTAAQNALRKLYDDLQTILATAKIRTIKGEGHSWKWDNRDIWQAVWDATDVEDAWRRLGETTKADATLWWDMWKAKSKWEQAKTEKRAFEGDHFRAPWHSRNKGSPVQPKEPEAYVGPWNANGLLTHADERQRLLYETCYLGGQQQSDGLKLVRLLEENDAARKAAEAIQAPLQDKLEQANHAYQIAQGNLWLYMAWFEWHNNPRLHGRNFPESAHEANVLLKYWCSDQRRSDPDVIILSTDCWETRRAYIWNKGLPDPMRRAEFLKKRDEAERCVKKLEQELAAAQAAFQGRKQES